MAIANITLDGAESATAMRDGKHPIKIHPTLAAFRFPNKNGQSLNQIAGDDEPQRRKLHPLQVASGVKFGGFLLLVGPDRRRLRLFLLFVFFKWYKSRAWLLSLTLIFTVPNGFVCGECGRRSAAWSCQYSFNEHRHPWTGRLNPRFKFLGSIEVGKRHALHEADWSRCAVSHSTL
jgi:hypothetical protein